ALAASAGSGNALLGNSIFSNDARGNGGLGIDLGDDGVTVNDASDADIGPNGLQNFPVLTGARYSDGITTISGVLTSAPSATFRIEFFLSDTNDLNPSGYGEGQTFIGSTNVTTGASGGAQFTG